MTPVPAGEQQATRVDAAAQEALLAATRELLWIETPADARAAAVRLVEELGGAVLPAAAAGSDALPVDLSFGDGEPLLPSASPVSVAHMLLSRHLPAFVRDAHRAVELAARTQRLAEDAGLDALTGLASRRILGRALGRLQAGDVVIMLDLDRFKQLNDSLGHEQGDRVLRSLGEAITDTVRVRDLAGRYGGEEFVLIVPDAGEGGDVEALLSRLRATWERMRPHPVTFSGGIAIVGSEPAQALRDADAAMYAAKRSGRDRWVWAGSDDAAQAAPSRPADPTTRSAPTFVAYSLLSVPEPGRDALMASFADRLELVDGWPGFLRLEIWADRADPTAFVMVSWWDAESSFRAYMGSGDHRLSHARIPGGELRPRPETFQRYEVIAR